MPKLQLRHALASEVALSQGGGLRVGIGARSARRHAIRAKCNFAHKPGPELELGTEEKNPRGRKSKGRLEAKP